MTDPISIFIVDDHPMIRSGLAATIAGEDDLLQVGEAAKLKFPRHQPEFSCPINHLRWILGLGF